MAVETSGAPGITSAGTDNVTTEGPARVPTWPGHLVGPLWVVARGNGRALVLLHGNSQSHRAFDRLVPLLSRPGRMLVGIDSRGHGRSPRGAGPLTIASMADDVAGVLDRLGLPDVDVLGFSDGGNIALELAIRHPRRVGALIVCGSNLEPDGLLPAIALEVKAGYRAARAVGRAIAPLRAVADRLQLMANDPHIDRRALGAVGARVLVVTGQHDIVRRAHTESIARILPRGELFIVPGVGHMVPTQAAQALADRMEEFLEVR